MRRSRGVRDPRRRATRPRRLPTDRHRLRSMPAARTRVGGRSVPGPARWNPARLLIGAQIALSLLLVTAAGLFGRSLYNLAHVDLGFDRDRVLNIAIDPRTSGVATAALPSFDARLLERVESVPGVKSAAFAECAHAGGCRSASDGIVIGGYTPAPSEQVTFQENRVSAEYLPTVGIRLLGGRNFDARDRKDTPKVARAAPGVIRNTRVAAAWTPVCSIRTSV